MTNMQVGTLEIEHRDPCIHMYWYKAHNHTFTQLD